MDMLINNKDHTIALLTNDVNEFLGVKSWCRSHFGKSHGDLMQGSWIVKHRRRGTTDGVFSNFIYSIIIKPKNSEMKALVTLTFG